MTTYVDEYGIKTHIDEDGIEWGEGEAVTFETLLPQSEADIVMDIRFPSLRTGRLMLQAAALPNPTHREWAREMIDADIEERAIAAIPTEAQLSNLDELSEIARINNLSILRTDMMSMPIWHRQTAWKIAKAEEAILFG